MSEEKSIIFKTGEITYPNDWYIENGLKVKPVVYTENFLKEIASNTMGSSLELTHGNRTNDVVGHVNEFDFIDNDFVANVNTNEEVKGKGFSPEFSAVFRDLGDKYEAIDGKLLKVILTENPRSHILCNSVEGGSSMAGDITDTLNNQINELHKEIAQKDITIKAYEEKINGIKELEEKVSKLETENKEYKIQIDELKPKAESFSKIENEHRNNLLKKAFGDDEESKKVWENASLEQLESLANHREYNREGKGIGASNTPSDDGHREEETPMDRAVKFYKKNHNGELPSFIKKESEDD